MINEDNILDIYDMAYEQGIQDVISYLEELSIKDLKPRILEYVSEIRRGAKKDKKIEHRN